MYGSNRKQSNATPRPFYQYENNLVEEEEEDDLYEPPPCDLQSRTLPCVWTAQENHSAYLDRSKAAPPLPKPPTPDRTQQAQRQQRPPPKQTRPAPPPMKHCPPLPDRRLSLPCTATRSPPPCNNNFPKGMDDLYLTLLETQVNTHYDVGTGNEGKQRQRSEDLAVMGRPWYKGEMERREAETALRRINKDGCFLVRLSSSQDQTQLYTLAVLYHNHIYNIPIRAVGNRGFSLGKEGKRYEEVFPSVIHLIEHYQREPLNLVNRQTSERECTALLYPAVL
ncbi:SH2 domain-containing protein 6 isoform X1 [Bufo gargarizans]|uniref:SH2 domain-containing protein 6 isoform X1 n=1 Tax=Bufo gargarizans TaxID=30331 RepID=UPI001CF22135|nr:SH2 domain-containing protein 6 isoform X1 [Bufo gargarizans]XP_044139021.1 SH2 domain-containing protein 6 isoform X1 [Bufo gargarizans]XP_044139022.1 SH2 domain-containing protein 6 isoform X1 [Bufo gargarizans]